MNRLTTEHHEKIRAHLGGLLGVAVDESLTDLVTQLAQAPEGEDVTLQLTAKLRLNGSSVQTAVAATVKHTSSIKHDIDSSPLELSQMVMEGME